jgi:Serine dehydrogenase proteinase
VGVYSEYLNRGMSFQEMEAERKAQLARISELRSRDVLVYAANLSTRSRVPISIEYADLLPVNDQLANLKGSALDLVIETPGGSGEVAEDIVKLLRSKYQDVAAIVPGAAKSAGTIVVMAADDILMEPASALGPIDAQIQWQGKVFSAEALLEGIKAIQTEVRETGQLNLAYLPILQQISPGEIQHAKNALTFAKELVRDWLATYKFKQWSTHSSTGKPVTDDEKRARADDVAAALANHTRWLTHGRSIKIPDLEEMRLKITDYSEMPELMDAIRRYHTLLQMLFDSNCYKVFETATSQIYRFAAPTSPSGNPAGLPARPPTGAIIDLICNNCKNEMRIQARVDPKAPDEPGTLPWPKDDRLKCSSCGIEHDLGDTRRQLEAQLGRPLIS